MKKTLTNFYLVVDLDLTFLHSKFDADMFKSLKLYSDPKNINLRNRVYLFDLVNGDIDEGSEGSLRVWGVYRTYLFEFLHFAQHYFKGIYVWSAGKYKYVHSIVELISNESGIKPLNVLTRDDCGYTKVDKHGKKYMHKPLEYIFKINPDANLSNTLALDDIMDNFMNNPKNGLLIPPYQPENDEDCPLNEFKDWMMEEDRNLIKLKYWLLSEKVIKCKDVRKLKKNTIFIDPLNKHLKNLSIDDLKENISEDFLNHIYNEIEEFENME